MKKFISLVLKSMTGKAKFSSFSNKYWLSISLENDEFGRYMLTSTPHSMHSKNSDKIEGYNVENLKNSLLFNGYIEDDEARNFLPDIWNNFNNINLNLNSDMIIHVTSSLTNTGGPVAYQFVLYDEFGSQQLDLLEHTYVAFPNNIKNANISFTLDLEMGNYLLALFGIGTTPDDQLTRAYVSYIGISNSDANSQNSSVQLNNIEGNINSPINQ